MATTSWGEGQRVLSPKHNDDNTKKDDPTSFPPDVVALPPFGDARHPGSWIRAARRRPPGGRGRRGGGGGVEWEVPQYDSLPSSTATTNVLASAVAAPAITAAFHPNSCRVLRLKLFRKHTVTASHDLGTYNYECRHFIDKNFLLSLPNGEKLLASAVTPSPACHELVCCGNNRPLPTRVLGMLPMPLPASMLVRRTYSCPPPRAPSGSPSQRGHDGKSSAAGAVKARKRKLSLELAHVLVVDSLPVPLHVSAKTLMEACEDQVVASDLCCCCAAAAPGAADEDSIHDGSGCGKGGTFCAEAFPRRFRSHEYWSGEGGGGGGGGGSHGTFCALSREEIIRVENMLMAHARGGGDRVYVARCAWCGDDGSSSPAGLKRCSGCLTAHYCVGRDCQKNDWEMSHRSSCAAGGAGDATPFSSQWLREIKDSSSGGNGASSSAASLALMGSRDSALLPDDSYPRFGDEGNETDHIFCARSLS